MRGKRHSLQNELMGIQVSKIKVPRDIDYEKVLHRQQEVIQLLEKQIRYLRQYLNYVADEDQAKLNYGEKDQKEAPENEEKTSKKITGLKGLLAEVMKIVQAKNPEEILLKLREMQEKANKKIEPVFVEKVVEKKVPIVIEKIKQVEKPVEIQKIVYQQVKVEVPVFNEKVIYKFVEKPEEETCQMSKLNFIPEKPKQVLYVQKPKPNCTFVQKPKQNSFFGQNRKNGFSNHSYYEEKGKKTIKYREKEEPQNENGFWKRRKNVHQF